MSSGSISGRRVRRLAVRAPSEALARRSAIALEDALHTASLPGGDTSRVIVIRRLALGRIRSDTSPAQLALAIEQKVWEMGSAAVHALDSHASNAPVVFFRDAAEPYVLLGRRIARGERASEWFWRAAVRGWRANAAAEDAWRDLVGAVARLEAAPAAIVQVVQALLEDGTSHTLCASMRPQDGTAWLHWFGWPRTSATPTFKSRTDRVDALPSNALACLRRWAGTWGAHDDRTVWLATVLLVAARRSHAADPQVTIRAMRAIESVASAPSPALQLPGRTASRPSAHARSATNDADVPARELRSSDAVAQMNRAHRPDAPAADQPAAAAADDVRAREPLAPWQPIDGSATSFAGLFFVIQLLNRLGIAAALEEQPEWLAADVPGRILDRVAPLAGISGDDPVMQVLAARPLARDTTAAGIDRVVTQWIAAMRRWCWRHPRVRLRALVATPGRIFATETHVDVHFALRQADVRVRKSGLDLDPGWVPWLGMVVRFHYRFGEPFHG